MKKFLVEYTKHEPYQTEFGELKENEIKRQLICLFAEDEEEAADMVLNNIKYSYTYYNTIDKVVEVTDDILDRLSDGAKWNLNHPINSENKKNWLLDKTEILF